MTSSCVAGTLDNLEFTVRERRIEIGAHVGVCDAVHAATETITDQNPFIDHRFALKVLAACKRPWFAKHADGLHRFLLMLKVFTSSTYHGLGLMA